MVRGYKSIYRATSSGRLGLGEAVIVGLYVVSIGHSGSRAAHTQMKLSPPRRNLFTPEVANVPSQTIDRYRFGRVFLIDGAVFRELRSTRVMRASCTS